MVNKLEHRKHPPLRFVMNGEAFLNTGGLKVDVYYNLHKSCWSVRSRDRRFQYGRVIAHVDYAWIKDAQYVVSEKGRQRVLKERRKNVHAFVRGTLLSYHKALLYPELEIGSRYEKALDVVSYNPFKGPKFTWKNNGKPVDSSRFAWLNSDRKVFAPKGDNNE